MQILIPAIGSRGDVQPFIALAQGLNCAGHAVTVASHPMMKSLVESHGVAFQPMGPDIDLSQKVAAILANTRSAAAGLMRGMRFSFDMLQQSHDDILALCRTADLVVVSAQSAAGKNEADQLGLPYLSVTFMPWAIPWDDPARPLWKRTAYGLMDGLVSLLTTRPLNRIRKDMGLPAVGKEGFTSLRLNLVPVSPAIYEPNPFWESQHKVVGYWFAEDRIGWEPPSELFGFLEAGEPPLLISFGAMSLGNGQAKEAVDILLDSLHQVSGRAIIQGWESVLKGLSLSDRIYPVGSLPHSWLLPRCAAVVHHGGFGTTAAVLRAGIPALIIPHIADQFFWADIVHKLGVSPRPIRRARLSRTILATSLDELMHNEKLCTVASSLGERIRNEHGVQNAVRQIDLEFS